MSGAEAVATKAPIKTQAKKSGSMSRVVLRRIFKNRTSLIGVTILTVLIIVAFTAKWIAPYSPTEMDYSSIKAHSSLKHLFGTDQFGRDLFSRCIYGARYSLSLGLVSALSGTLVGLFLGTIIGYYGGKFDMILMRFCEIWASIPGTMIVILLSSVMGRGFVQTIIAMSIGGIPHRIQGVRAMCIKEREQEYLEAAVSINCSKMKIMFKHMMPNTLAPLIISTTMGIGTQIMSAAALSYIGLGVQAPLPEWGAMLSGSRSFILTQPHMLVFPGLCIALTVLSINMLGDGLRDALDPRLKD